MVSASEAPSPAAGRRYVLAAVAILLLFELGVTGAYVVLLGTGRLPQQAVRFLLLVGLCYALLRRQRWARWVTVALLLLGQVTAPLLAAGAFSSGRLPGTLVLLALLVPYGVVISLLFVASVRTFFAGAAEPSDPGASPAPPVA